MGESTYRCGLAARWLPRALAGSCLVAILLVTSRFAALGPVRLALIGAVAGLALWVVRKGGEVRLVVALLPDGVEFVFPRGRARIGFEDVEGWRYDSAFASSRSWIPAAGLIDRRGRVWRLPTFLLDGERLVTEICERSGRQDLATWSAVLSLEGKMRRGRLHVAIAYGVAAVLPAAAVLFLVR